MYNLLRSNGLQEHLASQSIPIAAAETLQQLNDLIFADRVIHFSEDFFRYTAGDWTVTTTEAGAGSATEALLNGQGGWLQITTDDADNDNDFLQLKGEPFKFVSGKVTRFATKIRLSEVTQSDFFVGLQITDTTPLAVSDGVFFRSDDGSTDLTLVVEKDGTETESASLNTMVDATVVELAFLYDGGSNIFAFVDGAYAATLATTNLPDDEDLTVSFGIQNGTAAAMTMDIDFIDVIQER